MSVTDRSSKIAKHAVDNHILYGRECGCGEPCATDDAYAAHLADAVLEEALPALIEERDRARRAIGAVLLVHQERQSRHYGEPSWCASCGNSWPCRTARAVMSID